MQLRQIFPKSKRLLLTGAFLSIGLITNFLSLKEIFLMSLQGKPIFGVNLQEKNHKHIYIYLFHTRCLPMTNKTDCLPLTSKSIL